MTADTMERPNRVDKLNIHDGEFDWAGFVWQQRFVKGRVDGSEIRDRRAMEGEGSLGNEACKNLQDLNVAIRPRPVSAPRFPKEGLGHQVSFRGAATRSVRKKFQGRRPRGQRTRFGATRSASVQRGVSWRGHRRARAPWTVANSFR
jgi:hypothetical protein